MPELGTYGSVRGVPGNRHPYRYRQHTVSIDKGAPIQGVSTVQPRQAETLAALNIKKPTIDAQLTLL